jgi:putative zinc finger/helix-turn-helix YgiT family protein
MHLKNVAKEVLFRSKKLKFRPRHYVCPVCGMEADDLALAAANQKALSDAYRASVRLLTSGQIVEGRRKQRWTQDDLAKAANVGIASIKRWETGQIQTRAMDGVLRRVLSGQAACADPYTGNRPLSLDRVKLVLEGFSRLLGRKLLRSAVDRMLYAAKYLWYADMIAFRELGQSMTGATYAALPQGPQLNNYRELVSFIRQAHEDQAESLSEQELRILSRIAMAFPSDQAVYRAAHKEQAYKTKRNGELIPYSEAESITGF